MYNDFVYDSFGYVIPAFIRFYNKDSFLIFVFVQSLCNSQDISVDSPPVTATPKGPFLGVPKGTIRRQTSIGKHSLKEISFISVLML